jgi:hypothetical protein
MSDQTTQIKKRMSELFAKSLNLSSPLYQLEMIRQKLEGRSLQNFDKEDILSELGSMQKAMGHVHGEMLRIHDLLKREDQ